MYGSIRTTGRRIVPAALAAVAALGATSGTAAAQGAPAKTSVQEQVLLVAEPRTTYFVSPRGQHVAAVVNRGSRVVVVHDGVDGPRFDAMQPEIAFSDDGSRYAYVARLGQEFVYMVDGKELMRVSSTTHGVAQFSSGTGGFPKFDESGKRVWFELGTTPVSGNGQMRIYIDGRPGPASTRWIGTVAFSRPDGERHAYLIAAGAEQVLVVDGKPAGYLAGAPQFTADGKSLFTTRGIAGTEGHEVLLDGKPYMRGPSNVTLHLAPVGSLVIGVVTHPIRTRTPAFLTLGNKKIPGSECAGVPGHIDRVYFSPDGKHFAARCKSNTAGSWVMTDGRKGQEYQSISSDVLFTADGRPVYQATSNNKYFVVVGDQESGPYAVPPATEPDETGAARAAVIAGNRVGFITGGAQPSVIIDGKAAATAYSLSEFGFSADGSRHAYFTAATAGSGKWLAVDGVEHKGVMFLGNPSTVRRSGPQQIARNYAFSPDAKHVAYFAFPASDNTARGIAINGRFFLLQNVSIGGNLTFTPDSRHLFWLGHVARARDPRYALFVDGEPVLEIPAATDLYGYSHWSMGDDGVLTFIAQDGDKIKRYRVTPGTSTSIDTMTGGR